MGLLNVETLKVNSKENNLFETASVEKKSNNNKQNLNENCIVKDINEIKTRNQPLVNSVQNGLDIGTTLLSTLCVSVLIYCGIYEKHMGEWLCMQMKTSCAKKHILKNSK